MFTAFIIHTLACDPGTFRAQDSSCQPCPTGTFMPNANATACWMCPLNSDPNANATHCNCRHGTVWNATDRYCQFCSAGAYFREEDGIRSCAPCPKDTYQSNEGQPHCFPCPVSTYSLPGSTSCSDCPLEAPAPNNTRCAKCPPGQEYDMFQGICTPCSFGFYKPHSGYQPCLPCPPDAYSDYGASSCVQCEPNSALMKNGSCSSCQPGQYYDPYLRQCHKCDRGSFTSFPNSMELCHVCAGHSYSFDGASSCIQCPPNQALMKNGSCASCQPGYYYEEHSFECEKCPPNHISRGGISIRAKYVPLAVTVERALRGASTVPSRRRSLRVSWINVGRAPQLRTMIKPQPAAINAPLVLLNRIMESEFARDVGRLL
ncbi:Signal peptide, CUB and EGF-like domain-containing protein 2 [Gracilariopsis chorda]|uniref:Signal peptide, CUB and EGF-like domain-containing protein 2 n=1 Tax=Gracilariopsis chorda TaxID=448386 RepID=A0A2V3J1M5_9FLOR|nr:Signal peptide, CUB and EGF-like domain-containing protein 2 [Gracilariopsis chorda]|eukprot:PXF48223.1 Signal peptide, CUB and EGF-like domain-containing protein 2 [Gracilariopsis chorda]